MRKGERERVRREKGKRLRPACLSGEKKEKKTEGERREGGKKGERGSTRETRSSQSIS